MPLVVDINVVHRLSNMYRSLHGNAICMCFSHAVWTEMLVSMHDVLCSCGMLLKEGGWSDIGRCYLQMACF